ncbi:hypothetical protein [Glycomyces buryatensis]|uniref:Uncharacterized protein n=1 Tax=Glycomyces buryatensis TaxID=2570927 RepID=A0A4V4HS73_9ACTN|nr:hypothetical protein [Glycomyces buryatensis]THV40646.1 hypothetical protein FAB82_15410 [Glycomyces buryatensis]
MSGAGGPIRVTGRRRKCIDTRHLAEALVRISIHAGEADSGDQVRGVIDRTGETKTRRQS